MRALLLIRNLSLANASANACITDSEELHFDLRGPCCSSVMKGPFKWIDRQKAKTTKFSNVEWQLYLAISI